jgi:hypothetical protein
VRRLAATLVALASWAVLAGCSGDASSDQADTSNTSGTTLSIVVTTDEGASPVTHTLECDPPGGNHPQPAQACAALKKAGKRVFPPIPADRACTQVFGGPQKAVVRGTYQGSKVDATFTRANGCEIDRWEKLGTTFFDVPLQ